MYDGAGGVWWLSMDDQHSVPRAQGPQRAGPQSQGIVESDGTVPQCEVTVQLSAPYNTTGGLVATVLNLIFTNWCVLAESWCTQLAVCL